MPFINGRFYINPTYGAALEAAREAGARAAAESPDGKADQADGAAATKPVSADGPIRRIEIETEEIVPSHSGRAQRGFVARIHRTTSAGQVTGGAAGDRDIFGGSLPSSRVSGGASSLSRTLQTQAPETHVFSNHDDLADFLRAELERESRR